jgi:hypothetical protein
MTGFGRAANGFVAAATATIGFLDGALVVAGLAVGMCAADLKILALLAGAFAAGVPAATSFMGGALAVGLRAEVLATLALFRGAFAAGVTAAISFLGGALVIADLAVDLRAADLTTLALLAGAFVAGARFAAIVLADFFAADLHRR